MKNAIFKNKKTIQLSETDDMADETDQINQKISINEVLTVEAQMIWKKTMSLKNHNYKYIW